MSRWMRFVRAVMSLVKWRPRQATSAKAAVVVSVALVGGVAFGLGRWIGLGSAGAQQPSGAIRPGAGGVEGNLYDTDYSGRVVAYVKGNIPIYRVELAEYLIARFGAERLEFLVNRKIVELACQARGIAVADGEVEHHFRQDLAALGPHTTPKLFYEQILKPYKKSILEYKEDVIRQRLLLNKLVEGELRITDADLHKTFDALYGPKVQCRWIFYKDMPLALKAWQRIRDGKPLETAFIDEAKQQFVGELAAKGGELDPINMHFGDPRIEKEAFGLKPGEMSQVIGIQDNTAVILLCQRHVPADPNKNFDAERLALLEITKRHRRNELIKEKLPQLRAEAAPRFLLTRQASIDQIQRETQEELNRDLPFRNAVSK